MYFLYDLIKVTDYRRRIVRIFEAHNYELPVGYYKGGKHYKVKNKVKHCVTKELTESLLAELDILRKQHSKYNGSYNLILMLYNSFPDFN
jgi:hypothetical protein